MIPPLAVIPIGPLAGTAPITPAHHRAEAPGSHKCWGSDDGSTDSGSTDSRGNYECSLFATMAALRLRTLADAEAICTAVKLNDAVLFDNHLWGVLCTLFRWCVWHLWVTLCFC